MSAAQSTGADTPDAQEYAGELGGFVLARSTLDRVSARRGDTDWLAAAWADPGTRVLVLDNARALVRFGDKEAELILVPTAEAPEGLRFLLGVDDAEVAYFGVMGPPGCLGSLTEDAEAPGGGTSRKARSRKPEQEPGSRKPGSRKPGSRKPRNAGPGGWRLQRRKPPGRTLRARGLPGRKPQRWKPQSRKLQRRKLQRRKPPGRKRPGQKRLGQKRLGQRRLGRRLRRQRPSSRR